MKTSVVLTRPELLKSSKIGAYELKAAMKVNTIKGFLLTNATAITLAFALIISGIIADTEILPPIHHSGPIELGNWDVDKSVTIELPISDPSLTDITKVMTEMVIGNPIPIPESEITDVNFADFKNIDVSLSSTDGRLITPDEVQRMETENNNQAVSNEGQIVTNTIPDEKDFVFYEVSPDVDLISLNKSIIYPELAVKAQLEGNVLLSVLLDERGKPLQINIKHSSSNIFNDEAVRAVKNAIFTPAIQNKVAVKSWISIPISFKLK